LIEEKFGKRKFVNQSQVEMSLGHTANRPPNLTLRQIRRSL